MPNAPREHSEILSTFINRSFVFKTFVLSIFEWPLKTGFTVMAKLELQDFHLILSKRRICWFRHGIVQYSSGRVRTACDTGCTGVGQGGPR